LRSTASFNGAAPNRGRKGRGEAGQAARRSFRFNGAAPNRGRKASAARSGSTSRAPPGFNGAAPNRGRKVSRFPRRPARRPRFNGAAPNRGRKDDGARRGRGRDGLQRGRPQSGAEGDRRWLRKVAERHASASTGPPPIGGGRSALCRRSAPVAGFNGAAPNRGRKARPLEALGAVLSRVASTGPPPIGGGRAAAMASRSSMIGRFNGAAPNRGRKASTMNRARSTWLGPSFNGAAPNRGRKAREDRARKRGQMASTGPPPIGGGRTWACSMAAAPGLLQRGRPQSGAEGRAAQWRIHASTHVGASTGPPPIGGGRPSLAGSPPVSRPGALQRGRPQSGAEGGRLRDERPGPCASTGPPPIGGGRVYVDNPGNLARNILGFNGAAPNRGRKGVVFDEMTALGFCFNGAAPNRGRKGVLDGRAHAGDDAGASTGPPPIGGGRSTTASARQREQHASTGPPPIGGGRRLSTRRSTTAATGFNGAAPNRGRKEGNSCRHIAEKYVAASTGPPPIGGGRVSFRRSA